jgi:hypothetical protein
MFTMKKILKITATLIFSISAFTGAYAADNALTPSGTFTLVVKALTMYDGETALPTSRGVLTFQGKDYPFTIQALTMGNSFGASTLKAAGVVYGMKDVSQFEGPFFLIGGGISSDETSEVGTYKNSKGIIAVMQGTLNGPLWIPQTGAVVKLLK